MKMTPTILALTAAVLGRGRQAELRTCSRAANALTFVRLVSLVVLCAATSCAGGVSGTIDNTSVPSFSSSALANAQIESFPDRDLVIARFATFGSFCEFWAADMEIQNDDASKEAKASDREALYQERAPQDWWTAEVNIIIDDDDDLDGARLEPGEFDDDARLTVTICHHEDWPEADGDELDFDADCYRADDGDVFFRYEGSDLKTIHIDGTLEMEDLDGDDAGDVSFGGSATQCELADDELEELVR